VPKEKKGEPRGGKVGAEIKVLGVGPFQIGSHTGSIEAPDVSWMRGGEEPWGGKSNPRHKNQERGDERKIILNSEVRGNVGRRDGLEGKEVKKESTGYNGRIDGFFW